MKHLQRCFPESDTFVTKSPFLFSHFLFAEIYKREYKISVAQTPVCKSFGIKDKLYFKCMRAHISD